MTETGGHGTIADIVRHQAAIRGGTRALSFQGRDTSFAELDDASNRLANRLIDMGIRPGDRIGYLGRNSDIFYLLLFATAKARAVLVSANIRLAPPELQFIVADAGCRMLFAGEQFLAIADELSARCPGLRHIVSIERSATTGHRTVGDLIAGAGSDDPALAGEASDHVIQMYTSGTTGLPKGVCLTNANYAAFFRQVGRLAWSRYAPGEAVLNAMPQFHVSGANSGLLAASQGATTVVVPDILPAELLDAIEGQRIAYAFLVPVVIQMLLDVPGVRDRDLSSLKVVTYGGSPISPALQTAASDILGCDFVQMYGMTETTGGGTYLPAGDHRAERGKLKSCGIPWPDTDIICVDEHGAAVPQGAVGEIAIRSAFVTPGYWNRDAENAAAWRDGYFLTGDAGYFDEDGYLFIHDRVKDMIVSGGENVYPAEVEMALARHPAVKEAAVVAVPDPRWGEAVKGIVVLREGAAASEAELMGFVRGHIAGYKCPKSIDFAASLPRNAAGKVLRKMLRDPFWEGHARKVG